MSPPGPFETEAELRALPAVRAVYDAFDADPGPGKMAGPNQRMLLDALAGAGVYLGAYDHRIAAWLANWEPQTVAVIAGWVTRASQAAARADELLAQTRDGPQALPPGDRHRPTQHPPGAEVMPSQATPGHRQGGEPREEAR